MKTATRSRPRRFQGRDDADGEFSAPFASACWRVAEESWRLCRNARCRRHERAHCTVVVGKPQWSGPVHARIADMPRRKQRAMLLRYGGRCNLWREIGFEIGKELFDISGWTNTGSYFLVAGLNRI